MFTPGPWAYSASARAAWHACLRGTASQFYPRHANMIDVSVGYCCLRVWPIATSTCMGDTGR
eukprot:9204685-Alexandrium_andersonii.AAC.1